ncbi:hypothetical protein [Sulfuricurvum sp.]|uniref:hypothetical protein n=1 Tax=Sulfuricurvum sp. TaxID=2025608 RepID=UPI0035692397
MKLFHKLKRWFLRHFGKRPRIGDIKTVGGNTYVYGYCEETIPVGWMVSIDSNYVFHPVDNRNNIPIGMVLSDVKAGSHVAVKVSCCVTHKFAEGEKA